MNIDVMSAGIFENMSDEALLAAYNDICGTEAASLPEDRPTIIQRMLTVLAEQRKVFKKHRKKSKLARPRGRPHVVFNHEPKSGPKRPPRPNSRRRTVFDLCLKGATIQQCVEATGASVKQTYNDIRLLHVDMGYGIKEDKDGVITVYDQDHLR